MDKVVPDLMLWLEPYSGRETTFVLPDGRVTIGGTNSSPAQIRIEMYVVRAPDSASEERK